MVNIYTFSRIFFSTYVSHFYMVDTLLRNDCLVENVTEIYYLYFQTRVDNGYVGSVAR